MLNMNKKNKTFEEAMSRLEEIVTSLEDGNFALDKSLSLFEEGVKLVRECNEYLEKAEASVKKLVSQDGEFIEKDFNPVSEND